MHGLNQGIAPAETPVVRYENRVEAYTRLQVENVLQVRQAAFEESSGATQSPLPHSVDEYRSPQDNSTAR